MSEENKTGEGKVAVVEIKAGACGFTTVVTATSHDNRHVALKIVSECANIRRAAAAFPVLDAYHEVSWRKGKWSTTHEIMAAHGRHTSCPVTSGVIKAIEVCTGLAVPADAAITVRRETPAKAAMTAPPAAGKRPKVCSVCGAQATNRCSRCSQLYCSEHADLCRHAGALQAVTGGERAISDATCGICGRVVIDSTSGRHVSLATCRNCGKLVCNLCVGHVEPRPGPHGFSVWTWCEDCAPQVGTESVPDDWRIFLGR